MAGRAEPPPRYRAPVRQLEAFASFLAVETPAPVCGGQTWRLQISAVCHAEQVSEVSALP